MSRPTVKQMARWTLTGVRELALPAVSIAAIFASFSVADSSIHAARNQSDHDFVRTQELTAYAAFLNAYGVFTSDVNEAVTFRESSDPADTRQFYGWDQAALKASLAVIKTMPNIELIGSSRVYQAAMDLLALANTETGKLQAFLPTGKGVEAFSADFNKQVSRALGKFEAAAHDDVNAP